MPPQSSEPQPSAARNIYSFGITSFFNDMATEMAYWVLPAFLISLGAGPAQLGVIEGIAESVASFAKLFSGYLTDRLERRKPLVVGGYFVANAVKPLLAITYGVVAHSADSISDRLAKGVRGAPRDVMVAESVGQGTSRRRLWTDSIVGFGGRHSRAADGSGFAGTVWNSQRILGCCRARGDRRVGGVIRHSRGKPHSKSSESKTATTAGTVKSGSGTFCRGRSTWY